MATKHEDEHQSAHPTRALARGRGVDEERVGPATTRQVLTLIVAALITLCVANLAASRLLRSHPVNLGYYVVRHKWELLDAQTRPVDWLLLGDSSCNQGLRPDVIRRVTGESALNLCTIADALALSDAWMLDRYVARVGKPKHVLLAHVADMWERGQEEVSAPLLAQIPLPFGFWDETEPRLVLTRDQQWQVWLGVHVPLYADNVSLGVLLKNPGRLLLPLPPIDRDGYLRVERGSARAVAADAEAERARVSHGTAALSDINREALLHIVAVAERQGLDVTIVSAPLLDELWSFEPFRDRTRRVTSQVSGVVRASSHVRVLARDPWLVSVDALDNSVDHVVHRAAERYTEGIMGSLREPRP